LPNWAKPAATALLGQISEAARALREAILLAGYPGVSQGISFVISKKHRLIVTNAHVADIMNMADGKLVAMKNRTTTVYKVINRWYPPGVIRRLDGLPVRSMKPEDGSVDPTSSDLAVLQLEEGAELPMEAELANWGGG
jgi:hypothetical protein